MAYLHAINMQLKRFPKLAECDALSKSAVKQRKWVGFRHQFSWDRHSARDCKSYQNKGNKKFTPWDLRNPPIQTPNLNTENVRPNLSSAPIQEDLNLRLLPPLTAFLGQSTCCCFLSCHFKKCQWLCTQIHFINWVSFIYCIIYTYKELVRCNTPLQNFCNFFPLPYHQTLCFWDFL